MLEKIEVTTGLWLLSIRKPSNFLGKSLAKPETLDFESLTTLTGKLYFGHSPWKMLTEKFTKATYVA